MVIVLAYCVVDGGFDPPSDQTIDNVIGKNGNRVDISLHSDTFNLTLSQPLILFPNDVFTTEAANTNYVVYCLIRNDISIRFWFVTTLSTIFHYIVVVMCRW
jgi:hypothetical protein